MKMETNHAYEQAKAQMSSIHRMVAALECDYDRLEELKDSKTMRYVAGWNMPGYLPDNAPDEFEDIGDAREYIASQIEDLANETEDESEIKMFDEYAEAVRKGEGELGLTVGNYHYFISEIGEKSDDDDELSELEESAGECTSRDDAEQAIQEDPLCVEVRSGWQSVGEELIPEEFAILLCTGGPAVRIMGELDDNKQPRRAWLEYQDWGTPWTSYHGENACQDALIAYSQQFFFGE
jgi:hypothetical protein